MRRAFLISLVAVSVLAVALAQTSKPPAYLVYTGGLLGQLDPCG